ncbi:MAG: carbonic anhydrase [Limisphaerales bacterium]
METLRVSDIVVCGHSQCGAMQALRSAVCRTGNQCRTCANGSSSPRP